MKNITNQQLRQQENKYPSIFPYADKFSINALAEKDLETSYAQRVVGKTSNRKPALGERILVIAKKEHGVHIFPAEIVGAIPQDDPRVDTWYDRGGNRWKNNYSINPLRLTHYLSNEEIIEICGCAPNESRKIWVDQMCGDKWGGFRQKILDHLLT